MGIELGQAKCRDLAIAAASEWLVTNSIGGYASGTVAGLLTRRYHGLLVAALQPPLGRTLMLAKVEEVGRYRQQAYGLGANRWADGNISPSGYRYLTHFALEGSIPVWQFALAEAVLEKRLWMEPGANTTYLRYTLTQAEQPLQLQLSALVNYRDYHGDTQAGDWQMAVQPAFQGVEIRATPQAVPLRLWLERGQLQPAHQWFYGFDLAVERYRGFTGREDHLLAATGEVTLQPGESVTFVASTEASVSLEGGAAQRRRQAHEQAVLGAWQALAPAPDWINQLVLAADQFIVERRSEADPTGKTVIAGYPWFSDWGRDTMISLPGLTLVTGRPAVARSILLTFAQHASQGMLPNRFPDAGDLPEYNTVDATLWYFQAVRAYCQATADKALLAQLYPVLVDIVAWHQRGTRYGIRVDPSDGLLMAGEAGVQLTWMDAKFEDWVVTPRIGKPVEVNALWYGALRSLAAFTRQLGYGADAYEQMADRVAASFSRFWHPAQQCCYDLIDGPNGNDASLRPNQIFAVSLPDSPLSPMQQQQVVAVCQQHLLTPYGLRSLSPHDPAYQGRYGGNLRQRDGAYHQGTVWGWLLGPFALAHLRVYNDPAQAQALLQPLADHLMVHGLGSISEIFDGDWPFTPRGCIAQAWSVAETLRAWQIICRQQAETSAG